MGFAICVKVAVVAVEVVFFVPLEVTLESVKCRDCVQLCKNKKMYMRVQ